jgi:protein-S-isoprenylcysteine O-methyltransferase Ste14
MNLLATALACLYLPVPFTMLRIHLLHHNCGVLPRRVILLNGTVYVGCVVGVAALYSLWPWGAWPFHPALRIVGMVLIVAAMLILALTYREIDSWTAMAGPQVTGRGERALITDGVFSVIRHPRYAVLIVGALGNFLFTGYPLLLAAFVVTTGLTLLVISIEERELVAFFGGSYLEYRRIVPALVPRIPLRGRSGPRS